MSTWSEIRLAASVRVVLALAVGLVLAPGANTPASAAEAPGIRPLKLVVTPRKPSPAFKVGARPANAADAARFLTQATFGPASVEEIERLIQIGYDQWFEEQFNLAPSKFWEFNNTSPDLPQHSNYIATAFFTRAVIEKDQLRLKMIWALSQIFVISGINPGLSLDPYPSITAYMDLLAKNAFGNYRTLLEDVTYSPHMGMYLTFIGNEPDDPKTGRVPDNNYAREIMQLFSIGLWRLNQDGTQVLVDGKPVPTYGFEDIKGLSRVFTGLTSSRDERPGCQISPTDGEYNRTHLHLKCPMFFSPGARDRHSELEKKFLGVTIKAGPVADPYAEVDLALDTLAGHPNNAPFISRQLIQRFVTSNPSPPYVGRVARVYRDSKGDFKKVLKAILLDVEARDPAVAKHPAFGKVREQAARAVHMARALNVKSDDGALWLHSGSINCYFDTGRVKGFGGQNPFHSPTVFNFYRPGFSPPGSKLAAADLVAPELQILDTSSLIQWSHYVEDALKDDGMGMSSKRQSCLPGGTFDYTPYLALANNPTLLVDRVALLFTSRAMSAARRKVVVAAVAAATGATIEARNKNRVRVALGLVLISPDAAVQR